MLQLATLLNIESQPFGDDEDKITSPKIMVAKINESNCIGCTKCITVCPVNAIIGAHNVMHTIISNACTGCNLCVEGCPTNCIKIQKVDTTTFKLEEM